jgi:hypothetical protein
MEPYVSSTNNIDQSKTASKAVPTGAEGTNEIFGDQNMVNVERNSRENHPEIQVTENKKDMADENFGPWNIVTKVSRPRSHVKQAVSSKVIINNNNKGEEIINNNNQAGEIKAPKSNNHVRNIKEDIKAKKVEEFAFKGTPNIQGPTNRVRNKYGGKNPQHNSNIIKSNAKGGKVGVGLTSKPTFNSNALQKSQVVKTPSNHKISPTRHVTDDFNREHIKLLQQESKETGFFWKSPLEAARVDVDAETLAFAARISQIKANELVTQNKANSPTDYQYGN